MIRLKGILVTGLGLSLTVGQIVAQTPGTTFDRLRSAAFEAPQESVAPVNPLKKSAKKPTPQVEMTDAKTAKPLPLEESGFDAPLPEKQTPSEKHTGAREANSPQPSYVIINNATATKAKSLDAKPAVHVVEKAEKVVNPTGGNVIHAEYQPKDQKKSDIVQVSSTVTKQSLEDVIAPAAAAKSDPHHPNVTVVWKPKSEILVGEECEFDLVVKNNGDVPAQEIEVDSFFPESVRLTAARPKPAQADDKVTWKIEKLAPGAELVMAVKLIPSQRGDLALSSSVRFTGKSANTFVVAEPMLAVAIEGQTEVLLGEPTSHTITISNPGTGTARDVSLEALIPSGLKHPRGERLLLEVGSLEPGATREIRLSLAAIEGGDQEVKLAASASNTLRQTQTAKIVVAAPSLALKLDGPGLRYKGRRGIYELIVENDGTAVTQNVRVRHRLPVGFDFIDADQEGKFDPRSRTIDWTLGEMKPGEKQNLQLVLNAVEFGEFKHEAAVVSDHGAQAIADLETRIEGASALALEILDLDDPVEVGMGNAYEIKVKNDGSIAATNVGISFEIPKGVEFVSADGPAEHQLEDGVLFFRPVDSLDPGKTVSYQITVKGVAVGNHRFRARLASDAIVQPLIFEEMTKFYGE